MKAQMSLEMLAYLAIAGISLVLSLAYLSNYYVREGQSVAGYEYSDFVEAINIALMNGASAINIFVPEGLCNSTISGTSLITGNGRFEFVEPVRLSQRLKCLSGSTEANLSYKNGYVSVD